ncbi:MAG: hypothetical protein ACREIF_10255 [Chthoniobacterales bacterium]
MSLRSKLGIFVLTPQEQRTIAFIVLALLLGLVTRHYRSTQTHSTELPNESLAATASPSPSSPDR